jgi:hypothetical protein
MQGVKGSALQPDVDCSAGYSAAEQLRSSYNAMLSLSQLRQDRVRARRFLVRPAFATYYVVNAGLVLWIGVSRSHQPSVAELSARVARRMKELRHEKGSNPPLPPLALIP